MASILVFSLHFLTIIALGILFFNPEEKRNPFCLCGYSKKIPEMNLKTRFRVI